jgi:hypothetical protein
VDSMAFRPTLAINELFDPAEMVLKPASTKRFLASRTTLYFFSRKISRCKYVTMRRSLFVSQ